MFRGRTAEEIFMESYSQGCPALEPEQEWHALLALLVERSVVSLFNLSNLIFYVRIPHYTFCGQGCAIGT